ncbi:uncharacterized protein N7529_007140 [Penicillium soppii]|uniref:uncharacterized protein n=1 Tax=Penicillium soppii TaxID=69789 RepID=UPI002548D0D9|nr:uncharacterized protein N7529_007140 [Penicillium soppii]KAJ5865224.1 hypothetical protein N7529_007140 [Penicillium soppii]
MYAQPFGYGNETSEGKRRTHDRPLNLIGGKANYVGSSEGDFGFKSFAKLGITSGVLAPRRTTADPDDGAT